MSVKIVKSVLEEQIKSGKSMEFLMENYGLKKSQMKKAVDATGLKLKRQIVPAFVFAEETTEASTDEAPAAKEEVVADAKKDENIF